MAGTSHYHRLRHEGYLRHLLVRKAAKTGEILVALVTAAQEEHDLTPFMDALLGLELEGSIVGILHTLNDSVADVVQSDKTEVLYGQDYFYEELLGLKFRISQFSFFQTNTHGAEVLYSMVRDYIGSLSGKGNPVVYDLYSGTGTIAQVVAGMAGKVIGVEIIGEAVKVHKIVPPSDHKAYVMDVMKKCGLQTHYYERYPHEFSGGQRQRICIAKALALKPKLVICDEPVSALDVSIQAQVINLFKDLQEKDNLAYVFISHDLSVVEHISDEVGVMYLGNMVEFGSKKDLFDNPMHPYTQALFSAVPIPDPDVKMNRIILEGDIPSPANPPAGCKFHTRCTRCMDVCKEVEPVFKDYGNGHCVACHLYPQD